MRIQPIEKSFRCLSYAWWSVLCLWAGTLVAEEKEIGRESLNQYFRQEVDRQQQQTIEALRTVTPENWPEISQQWRRELREMLGIEPLPERTPLDAKVTGQLELEGVRIEKLHFQSRPGLYVTANLYLPAKQAPEKGWPTVLYVCGHANVGSHGRLWGNKTGYHHHGLWFARHDTACLTIDTIQLGELMGEHHGTYRLGRWDWISRGYTPAGVETWNAMRAIDYLETREEIDSEKIGITGRSGGGAYSWFTAAVDERIRVAVPVAGITDLHDHVVQGVVGGHCDCMYMVNYAGWDYPRVAALIAPRPLLLANSDNDTIFPLVGVMRTHQQLVGLYDQLNASAAFRLLITPGPHQDTQELQVGAFRWLLSHLHGHEVIVDTPALKELEPASLAVFTHETPADEHVTDVSGWFVPKGDQVVEGQAALEAWKSNWSSKLKTTVCRQWPANQSAVDTITVEQESNVQNLHVMRLSFLSHEPWKIGILHVAPEKETRKSTTERTLVWLADEPLWQAAIAWASMGDADTTSEDPARDANESRRLANGLWNKMLDRFQDANILVVAPRGIGPTRWSANHKDQVQILRRFYLLGQSLESMQLYDWLRATRALRASATSVRHWEYGGRAGKANLVALGTLLDESTAKLHLLDYVDDPQLAPCLPGLLKTCDWSSLRAAAGSLCETEEWEPLDDEPGLDQLLAPRLGPHQATGIRILEVSSTSAIIWARATQWPKANLHDLPSVEFEKSAGKGQNNQGARLPINGTAGLKDAVPGMAAEMRVRYRVAGTDWRESPWKPVDEATDYSALLPLDELQPGSSYELRVDARRPGKTEIASTTQGTFRTAPRHDDAWRGRWGITTCQEFEDRDGPFGFNLYRTMRDRETQVMVHAGDVVYYDKLARSIPLANYHWERTYGLPTLVEFHRATAAFFLKDDHDTYVNDSWPGKKFPWTDTFTFEQGQEIFRQQTALPTPGYRTVRWGKDLQVWMMEGRDYRAPNNLPDGPNKSIWGAAQWQWLQESLAASDATYRIVVSPTPIVGPDRENKHDNHANDAFATEGKRVRDFLSSQPRTFVICGDRHWQYHSRDPATGLEEFSVGPASDRHAGGWNPDDFRKDIHQYLRVGGGYLELDLHGDAGTPVLTLRHLDTLGRILHERSVANDE